MTKKEILDKLGTIRQSTIKSYQNCGINFRLRYIEGLKPSYRHPAALHGSSLHLLLFWLPGNWNMDIAKMYRKAFNHYEFGDEDTIFNINGNIGGKNGTRGTHIGADATLAEFKTLNGCSTVDKY